jgi:integrase
LFYFETDAKTVQSILRHANVSTTMAHYIIPDPAEAQAAMAKFSKFFVPTEVPDGEGETEIAT